MGWTGVYTAMPRTINAVREFLEEELDVKIVSMKFGRAWGIITEKTIKNRWPKDGKDRSYLINLIVCILWRQTAAEIMYKDMDESVGPFYYDIPMKWINLPCKVANQKWREKVRGYNRERAYINKMIRNLKPGDTVWTGGTEGIYTFTRMIRTMILAENYKSGTEYRIPRRLILDINKKVA